MKKSLKIIAIALCLFVIVFALCACNEECTEHLDANGDNKCDNCGENLKDDSTSTCAHKDENLDEKCDLCGEEMLLNDGKVTYSVIIKDGANNGYADIIVEFDDGNDIVMKPTNDNGVVYVRLVEGNYDINLVDTKNRELHYDVTDLRVTPARKTLTIIGSKTTSGLAKDEIFGVLDDFITADAFVIEGEGSFFVDVTPSGKTAFKWLPKTSGVYTFTFESEFGVTLTYHGGHYNVLGNDITPEDDRNSDESINITVYNHNLASAANERETTPYIIGVKANVVECSGIFKIEKTAEAPQSIYDVPWDEYQKALPGDLEIEGVEKNDLTYVKLDGTDTVVFNPEDGLYHLNSIDGKVLYIQLTHTPTTLRAPAVDESEDYFTLSALAENQRFGVYEFNEDGSLKSKKSYHEHILACIDYATKTDADGNEINPAGVYYLTEGMIEGVKAYGENAGWWDFESEGHIFGDKASSVNVEFAWMFAVCYVA